MAAVWLATLYTASIASSPPQLPQEDPSSAPSPLMAATVDYDNVPYDAPLTFTLPTKKWIDTQTRKGGKGGALSIPDADFRGKWVIITGANNGIGREAAIRMASWGANIILGCRNPPPHEVRPEDVVSECLIAARSKDHKETLFEWWEIDMANLSSVEAFAKRWLDSGRVVDVLCNNAGMGSSPAGTGKTFHTKDGFEIIHQVRRTIYTSRTDR